MKNVTLLQILAILIFAAGCQNVDIKKQIQTDYVKSTQFFNSKLVDHFPPVLSDSSGYQTNVLREYNLAKFCFATSETMIWKNYQDKEYFNLQRSYDSVSREIYLSSDTNLMLVFSYCDVLEIEGRIFKDQESPERQQLAKHNVSTATSLPVPLFGIDEYKGNTMCGLTDDFKLYVFDTKPGKYIDDKYLQECECLPKEWEHGYSKGVALSDERKAIIYWVVVW